VVFSCSNLCIRLSPPHTEPSIVGWAPPTTNRTVEPRRVGTAAHHRGELYSIWWAMPTLRLSSSTIGLQRLLPFLHTGSMGRWASEKDTFDATDNRREWDQAVAGRFHRPGRMWRLTSASRATGAGCARPGCPASPRCRSRPNHSFAIHKVREVRIHKRPSCTPVTPLRSWRVAPEAI